MSMGRRIASGALGLALFLLGGCSDDGQASPQSSASSATSSAPTESPTPEDLAAEAATEALEELVRVADMARQEPTALDWEPEIRRFAADPAAYIAVQSVREYATLGLRQSGSTSVKLEVADIQLTAPEGPSVRIAGCYDSRSTQVIDVGTGEAVPSGTPSHYVWDITVIQYESEPGAPWLVTTLDPLTDEPC
jgi:hypothetical protein